MNRKKYDKQEPKLYQTEYGTWRVRFYDEASDSYRSKMCRTKTEAENLKRCIASGENLSNWFQDEREPQDKIKTFKDLAERWIDHGRHVRQISESCLSNYTCHLKNHIFPVIGNHEVSPQRSKEIDYQAPDQMPTGTEGYRSHRTADWLEAW